MGGVPWRPLQQLGSWCPSVYSTVGLKLNESSQKRWVACKFFLVPLILIGSSCLQSWKHCTLQLIRNSYWNVGLNLLSFSYFVRVWCCQSSAWGFSLEISAPHALMHSTSLDKTEVNNCVQQLYSAVYQRIPAYCGTISKIWHVRHLGIAKSYFQVVVKPFGDYYIH